MLVRHFAAAEAERDFHLVAVFEEAGHRTGLHLIIMGVDVRTHLDFLEFSRLLLLLGGVLLLLLFVAKLAIVDDLADRGVLVRRNFDEVESCLLGSIKRGRQRHHALFFTMFVNEQHLVCPDIPVNARSCVSFGRRGRMRSTCYGSSPLIA